MKISRYSAFNSYPNLGEWTRVCLENSQSEELRSLIRSHNYIYEKEQAKFISRFYSKMKLATLKKQVGKHNY